VVFEVEVESVTEVGFYVGYFAEVPAGEVCYVAFKVDDGLPPVNSLSSTILELRDVLMFSGKFIIY
jgi:hypothetical protein